MPSKRQPAKQRRAAKNRAARAARAARSEHAGTLSESAPRQPTADRRGAASADPGPAGSGTSESGATSTSGDSAAGADSSGSPRMTDGPAGRYGGFLSGWLGGGRSQPGVGAPRADGVGGSPASPGGGSPVGTRPTGSRPPGSRAALFAVAFAVASFLLILIYPLASVDDRGDVVPRRFGGVYLEARSLLTGEQVEATETTVMSAYGPMTLLLYAVPMLIAVTAYVAHKRTGVSRPLTFGMLGLAVGVFITGAFFMPSLIALAIGSFQARRAELPARTARRAVRAGSGDANNGDGSTDHEGTDHEGTDNEGEFR